MALLRAKGSSAWRMIGLVITCVMIEFHCHHNYGGFFVPSCYKTHAFVFKSSTSVIKRFRGHDSSSSGGVLVLPAKQRGVFSFVPTSTSPMITYDALKVSIRGSSAYSDVPPVDPLVARMFEDEREDEDDDDDALNGHTKQGTNDSRYVLWMESLRRMNAGIVESLRGMWVWRNALSKGRCPIESDFGRTKDATATSPRLLWPPPPLFSYVVEASSSLQLCRLASRHPETIPMILRSILRRTFEYARRRINEEFDGDDIIDDDEDTYDNEEEQFSSYNWEEENEEGIKDNDYASLVPEEFLIDEDKIARDVAGNLIDEWSEVVRGVSLLDDMFGFNHGLLSCDDGEDDDDDGTAGASVGFGLRDGIWSHTGWEVLPALQQRLLEIPELARLVRDLGRRPCADDEDRRRFEKFAPRKRHPEGAMGAEFDRRRFESTTGLALTGNLAEMLPSEALLLRRASKVSNDDDNDDNSNNNNNHSRLLRRLFLAKLAESKLQGYERSGWADVPSVPRTRPLYRNRLPSAPGGPIVVCLDTSWSMSGSVRENLSKAVVLSCVMEARRQGRQCRVVSFSTERKVMESGVIGMGADDGIRRLMEFLSHSFGGGTDVTGALKFAIADLEGSAVDNDTETNSKSSHDTLANTMEAADILLVTDGEIPDPPVPPEVMASIERLKLQKDVKIHGLLVGKSESLPLSRICTHTHDFLSRYTLPTMMMTTTTKTPWSAEARATHPNGFVRAKGRIGVTTLHAKRSRYVDNDDGSSESDKIDIDQINETLENKGGTTALLNKKHEDENLNVLGEGTAEENLSLLKEAASDAVARSLWTLDKLNEERAANGKGRWDVTNKHLKAAISRVEDGLVERGEDARLVVLAMIANEHILLLGKPGTGKSVLGLRLAQLCEGTFFQRLLTRFTTPEELFGPLSLKSLENDEYRRVTMGYLPTADIAFLDEIFKANSAILNTLLTILNERKFDNGGNRESCPVRCVVGASNELPDSEELVALYDRFLIRKEVVKVSDQGVMQLLSMSNPGESPCETETETETDGCDIPLVGDLDGIIESLSSIANSVVIDDDICELMRDMRSFLWENHEVEISDRRLVKAARLLKISAASDGRKKVDSVDLLLLQHCFWNEPGQRVVIREWLWDNLTPSDHEKSFSPNMMRFLLDNLRKEIVSVIRKTNGCVDGTLGVGKMDDFTALQTLREEAERLATIAQQRLDALIRHTELVRRSDDSIWIESDDANTIQQLLLPRAEELLPQMQKVAGDAKALVMALSTTNSLVLPNELREDIIEMLWEDGSTLDRDFTEDELSISSKEAKAKYDIETFRRWKRANKKANKKASK